VSPRTLPRHARPLAVGRWAGRMADRESVRMPAEAEAVRPAVRRDPLLDPLAVTEHCVIGDQIRLPATCCDMVGCGAEYADPAALGEADNRARALVAGWRTDAFGRLLCPACQQHHGVTRPRIPGPGPEAAGGRTPAAVPPGPGDGGSPPARARSPSVRARHPSVRARHPSVRARHPSVRARHPSARAKSPSVRARVAGSPGAISHGRHRMWGWLHVLTALASGNNGWGVTQPFTGLPQERNDAGPRAGAA
jgi:hypothetical protein